MRPFDPEKSFLGPPPSLDSLLAYMVLLIEALNLGSGSLLKELQTSAFVVPSLFPNPPFFFTTLAWVMPSLGPRFQPMGRELLPWVGASVGVPP